MKSIVFIGYMGSGKTTMTKYIGNHIDGIDIYDIDDMIKSEEGMEISRIFEIKGEDYFRNLEAQKLEELALKLTPKIVSTGGGVVEREDNISLLKKVGLVVFLDSPIEVLWDRVGLDPKRPLAANKDKFFALYESRRAKYLQASDIIIDSSGFHKNGDNIDEVASIILDEILEECNE